MDIKNKKNLVIIEQIILFSVLFLPGYLSMEDSSAVEMFNNLSFNIMIMITSISQIALIVYLQHIKKDNSIEFLKIKAFKLKYILSALLVCLGIYVVLIPFLIIINLLPEEYISYFANPVDWKINNYKLLPVILISCITSAYREEIFFRTYLINNLTDLGINKTSALIASSLLFGLGHIYQGLGGFIVTSILGYYFGLMLLKKQNLHILGIAHGLYNFSILVFTIFI